MITAFKKAKEAIKSKWPGFKETAGKVLSKIPGLFFVSELREVRPSFLTIIIIVILALLFRRRMGI